MDVQAVPMEAKSRSGHAPRAVTISRTADLLAFTRKAASIADGERCGGWEELLLAEPLSWQEFSLSRGNGLSQQSIPRNYPLTRHLNVAGSSP